MAFKKTLGFMKANWMFYLMGIILIIGIKYSYSKADSTALQWILAPTAWWVRTLSGIPFIFDPDAGYVNYGYRFIIAPSCSGVQFIMIAIATLVFSFVHRMRTVKRGLSWIAISLGISYVFTIFINGFRIVLSIYLPLYLAKTGLYKGWLTPERLHTMTGIAVYFTGLIILYCLADRISRKFASAARNSQYSLTAPRPSRSSKMGRWIYPVFWYFAIVLGIPFLNRAYGHNKANFTEYAMLMAVVCGAVLGLLFLGTLIWRRFARRKHGGGPLQRQ